MSCKGNTEPRQNAGRYPTSIALRFYIWIADTKACFCALSAARRQRPAMHSGTRCPPAPPRPIPPAISRPAAGFFVQLLHALEGLSRASVELLGVLQAACRRPGAAGCERNMEDMAQVPKNIRPLLMLSGCCPSALAQLLEEGDIVYAAE